MWLTSLKHGLPWILAATALLVAGLIAANHLKHRTAPITSYSAPPTYRYRRDPSFGVCDAVDQTSHRVVATVDCSATDQTLLDDPVP
ncbi:MAG: hypothetical protein P4M00_14600 [Azospirillaceae bacterium]|nr:hypothetical protein [Azospirillaceae bacterium]